AAAFPSVRHRSTGISRGPSKSFAGFAAPIIPQARSFVVVVENRSALEAERTFHIIGRSCFTPL
ncbi:MAG TPA: hypothetical protein VMM84_16535, partial [Pyrinomonadaceae bacterium]|nr:hypothetical protein [Pyrinomonadaceae bacterium]